MEFDATGRRIGRQLLWKGQWRGVQYLLHPIVSVRYVEFPFVQSCLPPKMAECLDVSSPRLFSLHLALHRPAHITMLNPDPTDVAETAQLLEALHISRISLRQEAVDALGTAGMAGKFDAVWSISVVEHIEGSYTDGDAMRLMYGALKPGGRLMITVPVDRQFHVQSSKTQQYGTQPVQADGTFFFQRLYDAETIGTRLSRSIGRNPTVVRWFGEREQGWWNRYVASCQATRIRWAVADAREMARNFREFDTWDRMPGLGICGLMYEKPA